ncbi:hypothetical protein IK7_05566 [Bacillus cereus VD156]|uniref:Uncharacterized protein n=1 Tax=Bacillus cereus (strain VD014) TaxID=1053223 RepID=A0A9W5NMW1_BACC8|nr:hypothetical protein IIA_05349 [Bacillus cereus VD014]EJR74655.1 hypothetical protein IK7_05566 [Bacillus cereus VD156]
MNIDFFMEGFLFLWVWNLKMERQVKKLLNKLMNSGIYKDYVVSIVGVTYLLLRNMIQIIVLSFSNMRLLTINRETLVSLQKVLLGILYYPS